MRIKAIRTAADHEAALARIDALMNAEAGTPRGEELDVLVDLVEHYEEKEAPIGFPTPVQAIEFRMEQQGLTPRDLVPFIGSRAKVSEVLSGKRPLNLRMARALHEHLGIPAEVLLQPGDEHAEGNRDWTRYPIRAMVKMGWLPAAARSARNVAKCMADFLHRAGYDRSKPAPLYRKSDQDRRNAKSDAYALEAWCWQALVAARDTRLRKRYVPGTVTLELLRETVRLSSMKDGPSRATRFLADAGIALVVVPHLKRTYLDGAALKLADGTPVVALTLRYDRVDNFWFCLLHELAHLGRHLDCGEGEAFVDDLDIAGGDRKEAEADEWAREAAIPRHIWESSPVASRPTPMAVVELAQELRIHPAIVAGRVRYERKNFRMLSYFVGQGEIRKHFSDAS